MKRPEQGGKAAIVRRTKRQPDMCACAHVREMLTLAGPCHWPVTSSATPKHTMSLTWRGTLFEQAGFPFEVTALKPHGPRLRDAAEARMLDAEGLRSDANQNDRPGCCTV